MKVVKGGWPVWPQPQGGTYACPWQGVLDRRRRGCWTDPLYNVVDVDSLRSENVVRRWFTATGYAIRWLGSSTRAARERATRGYTVNRHLLLIQATLLEMEPRSL